MSKIERQIIQRIPNTNSGYVYYKILGDGHCFLNCFLEPLCNTYKHEHNKSRRSCIARKLRLDFANYLMTFSSKSAEEISIKLNILNPTTMFRFFKHRVEDKSVYTIFEEIKTLFLTTNNFDIVFEYILDLDLLTRIGTEVDILYITNLYQTDPRINDAIVESNFTDYTDNLFEKGIDKFPINLNYFDLIDTIPGDSQTIVDTIKLICHPTEFFEHMQSVLFANFIRINLIIFQMIDSVDKYYRLIENIEGVPDLLMVNLSNVHWNLVSFDTGIDNNILMFKVDERTLNTLFKTLKEMYKRGNLPL